MLETQPVQLPHALVIFNAEADERRGGKNGYQPESHHRRSAAHIYPQPRSERSASVPMNTAPPPALQAHLVRPFLDREHVLQSAVMTAESKLVNPK